MHENREESPEGFPKKITKANQQTGKKRVLGDRHLKGWKTRDLKDM